MMKAHFLVLFCLGLFASCHSQSTDETLKEKAKGADVVEAVVRKIQRTGIFSYENLLRRVAFVETQDGEDASTYRANYYGGIWQVDEDLFNKTKNETRLAAIYRSINTAWNIDWSVVQWTDLLKPLYSGLAARLFFENLALSIPGTVVDQANYWKQNYRINGSTDLFISQVKRLESDGGVCEGQMDICIVLDGSGSIGTEPFKQAKGFVADLVKTFSPNSTRVAFVLFSKNAENIFEFNNTLSQSQMENIIRNVHYPSDATNTPGGLQMAVQMFNRATVRPGVPRLVATFTDGNHSPAYSGSWNAALSALRNANLTSFSVGIGNQADINENELLQIALGERSRVFRVTNYDALAEFFYQMNSITCEVPQEPGLGEEQNGTLAMNEKRYFKFQTPDNGLTFKLSTKGNIEGWWSYLETTPNSALYDGVLRPSATFIPKPNQGNNTVYVTIKSTSQGVNEYIVATDEGNTSGSSSSFISQSAFLMIFAAFITKYI